MEQNSGTKGKRTVKSRRASIRLAIRRRIKFHESLSVRAILAEAGGGSTTTVREELALVTGNTVALSQVGHFGHQSQVEELAALKSALADALKREASLVAENNSLRRLISEQGASQTYLLGRLDDSYRQLLVSVDNYREKAKVAQIAADQPPKTVIKEILVEDTVLKAQYQARVQENALLSKTINELRGELESIKQEKPIKTFTEPEDEDDDEPIFEHQSGA